jgi:hypothetical protein
MPLVASLQDLDATLRLKSYAGKLSTEFAQQVSDIPCLTFNADQQHAVCHVQVVDQWQG